MVREIESTSSEMSPAGGRLRIVYRSVVVPSLLTIVGLRGGGSGKPSARAQRISAISTSELQLRASGAAAPWTQSVQATEPRTDNPGCGLLVTPPSNLRPRRLQKSSHIFTRLQ